MPPPQAGVGAQLMRVSSAIEGYFQNQVVWVHPEVYYKIASRDGREQCVVRTGILRAQAPPPPTEGLHLIRIVIHRKPPSA